MRNSAEILNAAPNAMIVVTSDGRMVLVNNATEDLFGYDREGLLGEPIETLVPFRFRKDVSWSI